MSAARFASVLVALFFGQELGKGPSVEGAPS